MKTLSDSHKELQSDPKRHFSQLQFQGKESLCFWRRKQKAQIACVFKSLYFIQVFRYGQGSYLMVHWGKITCLIASQQAAYCNIRHHSCPQHKHGMTTYVPEFKTQCLRIRRNLMINTDKRVQNVLCSDHSDHFQWFWAVVKKAHGHITFVARTLKHMTTLKQQLLM